MKTPFKAFLLGGTVSIMLLLTIAAGNGPYPNPGGGGGGGGGVSNPLTADLNGGGFNITNVGNFLLPQDTNIFSTISGATAGQVLTLAANNHYYPSNSVGGASSTIGTVVITNLGIVAIQLTTNTTASGGTWSNSIFGGQLQQSGIFKTDGTSQSNTVYQIGSTNNNGVPAGIVGEYVQASFGALILANNTAASVVTLTLTNVGDWDIEGYTAFVSSLATTFVASSAMSITTNVLTAPVSYVGLKTGTYSGTDSVVIPRRQLISITNNTLVYITVSATFAAGTVTATSYITARRMH